MENPGNPTEAAPTPLSTPLLRLSLALEWIAIIVGAFGAGILVMVGAIVAFHFLKPRSSPQRARIGIAVALAVIALGAHGIYARYQWQQQVEARNAAWEGVTSPAFSLVTLDGKRIDSAELRGKRVLLTFWATWCGVCRAEIPEINELIASQPDSDVVVVGISRESEATIREFLRDNEVAYSLVSLADTQLPPPYDEIPAYPTSYVLDRNGTIQYVRTGYQGRDQLRAAVWQSSDYDGPARQPAAD
ncbi:MAG TPA: TlpA disulfide reductase family protein [Terriglobales bacterium]|nr:TlpA disulfide reductase family protein [Terriglobales bacterium]